MTYTNPDALVSTDWLAEHLSDPNLRILDGTYHLPTAKRDAEAEFLEQHIAGAIRFNIDDVCDPDSALPHMLPSAAMFAEKVSALGISSDHRVVVYDVYGLQSAARTWWMFRVFGHDNVAVLNGGMPKWVTEGREMATGPASHPPATFNAIYRRALVRGAIEMRANVDSKVEQVLDARAAGRFTGEEPEPRAGMRSGHIPGSHSLPFTKLLEKADRTYLSAEAILAQLNERGLDLNAPMTTTCGSGVTACATALGLYLVGKEDVAVYDGSWSEWGGRPDTPIEAG